nr:hypothetical protein [Tanacetum cinerariifolium]
SSLVVPYGAVVFIGSIRWNPTYSSIDSATHGALKELSERHRCCQNIIRQFYTLLCKEDYFVRNNGIYPIQYALFQPLPNGNFSGGFCAVRKAADSAS